MKNIKKYIFLLTAFAIFSSCETGFDDPSYSSGTADLSSFVALGNSLTAGFADAALYQQGQNNSYPKMMAEQFAMDSGHGPKLSQELHLSLDF